MEAALCLFAFSLSFAPHWSSKALILLVVVSIFNLNIDKNAWLKALELKILAGILVYAILNILLLSGNMDTPLFKLVGLMLLFFLIVTQTAYKRIDPYNMLLFFVLGVFAAGIINFTEYLVNEAGSAPGFYNMWKQYSIIDIDKIYYAVYIDMAYLILLFLIFKKRVKSVVLIPVFLLSLPLMVYCGSVGGMLVFVVLNALIGASLLWHSYTKIVPYIWAIPLLIMAALYLKPSQSIFEKLDGEGSRIRNYNINREIIFDKPIFGYGIGKELETMQDAREEKSWEYINKYNAHNQYFQYAIGGGIVLVVGVISLLLLFRIRGTAPENLLYVGFVTTLLFIFVVESFLERHHGLMFFSFFLNVLWGINKQRPKCDIVENPKA